MSRPAQAGTCSTRRGMRRFAWYGGCYARLDELGRPMAGHDPGRRRDIGRRRVLGGDLLQRRQRSVLQVSSLRRGDDERLQLQACLRGQGRHVDANAHFHVLATFGSWPLCRCAGGKWGLVGVTPAHGKNFAATRCSSGMGRRRHRRMRKESRGVIAITGRILVTSAGLGPRTL
jgi:hypothetical protein